MIDYHTTWRRELSQALADNGESFDDVVSTTLTDAQLDTRFYAGYGGEEGSPFTLWTSNRVYFPICYDGAEWVGSAARNPDGKPTKHQGGDY